MRKFSHRGLSIKKQQLQEMKKMSSNHNLCQKNSSECPVLNHTEQLCPWGVVQNRGRIVGEVRGKGSEETAVKAGGIGVVGGRCKKVQKQGKKRKSLNERVSEKS